MKYDQHAWLPRVHMHKSVLASDCSYCDVAGLTSLMHPVAEAARTSTTRSRCRSWKDRMHTEYAWSITTSAIGGRLFWR